MLRLKDSQIPRRTPYMKISDPSLANKKIFGFLVLLGVIKLEHSPEMSYVQTS